MFKPNLSFKKPGLLGIDIGSKCVKIVKMVRKNTQKYHLDYCGTFAIPKDSPTFTHDLHAALVQNKLLGLRAAASIDDASLKIRKVDLPAMPDADLKEAVRWHMRDVVEGKIDDFTVSYSIIEETITGGNKREMLVGYAIKKEAVNNWKNLLIKVGLKPVAIEPSVISLSSCIERVYPSENYWIAGIDLGAQKALMVIMGNGKFYFSRPLPGIQLEEATRDKASFMKKLAGEVQNSMDTFSVAFHVEKIHRIFLSGGGAGTADLASYLTTNLAIKTEILDPFEGIEASSEIKKIASDKPYLYPQAASLAWIEP